MRTQIPENSLLFILLSDLLPAIMTVLVGGFLAARVFPRLQDKFDVTKHSNQRKRDLSEEITIHFEKYISSWRRLITISKYGLDTTLNNEEVVRRETIIASRNESRDSLLAALRSGQLYFSSESSKVIDDFILWDERTSSATLSELPEVIEWRDWQKRVKSALSREVAR